MISIHAPREGGDKMQSGAAVQCAISIHAPREGGDEPVLTGSASTGISIHAPREGGDCQDCHNKEQDPAFQSTPPVRGATMTIGLAPVTKKFQSTPPVRGAT